MTKVDKLLILILVLMVSFWKRHTLRCQLEDGPSEEELKKVVRICMKKLGNNSDRNNSDNSYEDSNSDESYDNRRNTNRGRNNNKNLNNGGNRFARDVDRWQQGHDNSYGNRNQERYDNGYGYENGGNNGFNYGNGFGNNGNPNYENNRNDNMSNRNRNGDEYEGDDKSCMIQCFFQEMKMTNSEGFPDKHKVERIVTQDVRDREMKNFLMDSIKECFHIVEMERRREKCVFSKNIVSCLAERAKANCDDYYKETMIF